MWTSDGDGTDRDYLERQTRIVLRHCGRSTRSRSTTTSGSAGRSALRRFLRSRIRDGLISQIIESGLRGRGGAGFPTGMKWRFTRLAQGPTSTSSATRTRGIPGAFMDRSVLESDPHAVLEGMAIAAFAIGPRKAYIYVRAEYPMAIERLTIAIAQAEERGLLGDEHLRHRLFASRSGSRRARARSCAARRRR